MEEFSELKSARLLSIYATALERPGAEKGRFWRRNSASRRAASSAIWSRCARSSPTKCCRRTWSMTARRASLNQHRLKLYEQQLSLMLDTRLYYQLDSAWVAVERADQIIGEMEAVTRRNAFKYLAAVSRRDCCPCKRNRCDRPTDGAAGGRNERAAAARR